VQFVAIRMIVREVIAIVITYRVTSLNAFKERKMNIAKNMEAIFVTAAVQAPMQVVVIKGKRQS
jgi:hypothetical protein